jgi:hypothetical protein
MKTSTWFLSGIGLVAAAVMSLAACGGSTVCVDTGCGATGGNGTGGQKVCGGFTGGKCDAGEYCAFSDGSCGKADQTGVCTPIPQACPLEAVPWEFCGCDGQVYGDACSAAMAGTDLSANGGCTLSSGQFACGGLVCETQNQYCELTTSDVAGQPDTYQCKFLPSACTAGTPPAGPDCNCVASEPCGSICTKDAQGNITLTCPGG